MTSAFICSNTLVIFIYLQSVQKGLQYTTGPGSSLQIFMVTKPKVWYWQSFYDFFTIHVTWLLWLCHSEKYGQIYENIHNRKSWLISIWDFPLKCCHPHPCTSRPSPVIHTWLGYQTETGGTVTLISHCTWVLWSFIWMDVFSPKELKKKIYKCLELI